MLVPISASGIVDSYSKARFFIPLLLFWALTTRDLRGLKKHAGGAGENVSVMGDHVKAGGWRERNDPSHGPPDSASSGQEHARFGNGPVRPGRGA